MKKQLYNKERKLQFLKSIPPKSQLFIATRCVFYGFYNLERKLNKDLFKMSPQEVIDGLINLGFMRYDDYTSSCKAINLYRQAFGASVINFPSESEYKTLFINKGTFNWVLDDRDLFIESLNRVVNYSHIEAFDYSEYFAMPIVYALFVYYGLTDEDMMYVTKEQLEDDWTLLNGRIIKDLDIREFIVNLNQTKSYEISNGVAKNYLLGEYRDHVIRLRPDTLRRSFSKLSSGGSDKLSLRRILEAGIFERQFEKDIQNRNFRVSLSRHQISMEDEYLFGFRPDKAEIYNVYKAVRFKHNV